MGTTYEIAELDDATLELDESSNEFEFWFVPTPDSEARRRCVQMIEEYGFASAGAMSTEDVEDMVVEMVKVLSYWTDPDDLKERLIQRIEEEI